MQVRIMKIMGTLFFFPSLIITHALLGVLDSCFLEEWAVRIHIIKAA